MAGQTIAKVVAGGKTHTVSSSFYGTCSTAANIVAKEVIINEPNTTETITPVNGMLLCVKFTNGNSATNPTLTVYNNSGTAASPTKGSTTLITAKNIKKYGNSSVDSSVSGSWISGAVVGFVYDGTNWVEISGWDNTNLVNIGGYIAPSYVGSFETDSTQNAACCRINDFIVTVSPNNSDGDGYIRIFNLKTNLRVGDPLVRKMGHGNSVAWDGQYLWIAPQQNFTDANISANSLFRYTVTKDDDAGTFTLGASPTIIPLNHRAYGVTYDAISQKLYAVDAAVNSVNINVYEIIGANTSDANQNSTLVYTLTNSHLNDPDGYGYVDNGNGTMSYQSSVYWQDFAIYNDVLYAAKLDGTIYVFSLSSLSLENTIRVGSIDFGGLWYYGEFEGLEFDAVGRLYNMRDCPCNFTNPGYSMQHRIGFVTELNTNLLATPTNNTTMNIYGEFYLVPATHFAVDRYHVHSLNELAWRLPKTMHTLHITANRSGAPSWYTEPINYTEKGARIFQDLTLRVDSGCTASFTGPIIVDHGTFCLYVESGGTVKFNMSSDSSSKHAINAANRPCQIYIRALGTITCNSNTNTSTNNLISTGYAPSIISFNGKGGLTNFYINGTNLSAKSAGLLYGSVWANTVAS